MSDVQKLKREMLRQVVRENRDLVAGRLPVPRTRHVSFRRLARMLAVIVLPVALFVSVNAISGGSGVKQEIVVVDPAKAVPKKAARGSASELPAPRAIAPVWPAPLPRARTSRTLIIVSSTMVPTFMRYCWATRGWAMRQRPSWPCRIFAKRPDTFSA